MLPENEGQEEQENEAILQEAIEMGWLPKEDYKGPEERWVGAEEFVERGHHILPLLQANNKKLKDELLTRDAKISKLEGAVKESMQAVKALQKTYTEATKLQVEAARKELKEQLRAAKVAGDVDTEMLLTDQIDNLKTAEKEAKADEQSGSTPPPTPELSPEFLAWRAENPWFNEPDVPGNRKRIKTFLRIAEDLREDGESLVGRSFMDKCMRILKDNEDGYGKHPSKVEGSVPGERKMSGGPNTYASLPKEAKEVCDSDVDTFVGPGKMFKTVQEWRTHYATLYFSQSQG